MKFSFLDIPYPMICGLILDETPEDLITESKNAKSDGAQGVVIFLSRLKPEFRKQKFLKNIVDSVNLPVMVCFYRQDKWRGTSDDARAELLLAAADVGASMIDVMGDLYDPSPMEITHNQKAIDKQKRLIDKIHTKGVDVVISSHMACSRTTEQVVEHMHELESRGPDVVKIVTGVNTEDELAEAFRTTITLKRELKKPFIHLCTGKFSRPHRFICPVLGVSIVFAVCHHSGMYKGMPQPTIKAMRAFLENFYNMEHCCVK